MKQILSFVGVLIAISFLATGCTAKSSEVNEADPVLVLAPHRTDVYFLIQNSRNCGLRAYVPEGSVCVDVRVNLGVTDPYVDIPREINTSRYVIGGVGKGEPLVAWGLGGTLSVKDVQQVKDLLLSAQERD